MAWNFADWILESTSSAKTAKLKQHIVEVSQALADPTSQTVDGLSYTKQGLRDYLNDLKKELGDMSTAPLFLRGRLSDQ